MKVVISIPAYNEESTIVSVLQDIKNVMSGTKYKYKISVINDGSTDRTAELAEQSGAVVTSHPQNYGLAETFKTEIKKATDLGADIIVHTDADGQYPSENIPLFLKEIESGQDLVLGSRFLGKIEHMPLMKKIGNIAFSKAISQITGTKITDAQTGFRAFTKNIANLNIISNHTYTQEQIIRAIRNKFKIKEIPINAKKTRPSKLMKWHPILQPFEYAIKAWINIFRLYRDFEPLKFFSYFAAALIIPGLLLGLFLTSLYLVTGRVGHIPATVLTMLLITSGIQIWLFGFLADMQKK